MEIKKIKYRWIKEDASRFPKIICVFKDKPCNMDYCPAWRSDGGGWGRCLMIPGYVDPEEE
jgi:hypothetical protein